MRSELKTYSLCCADCLAAAFQKSQEKQKNCRLAQGESLEPPGIYQLEHGARDRILRRLPELEAEISPQSARTDS